MKLLLLTFVVGSQLAPLSHFLFMVVSDYYADLGQQSAHAAHIHHAPTKHGVNLTEHNSHFECDYFDLFATFAATSVKAATTTYVHTFEAVFAEKDEVIVRIKFASTQSRAPPA